MRKIYNPKDQMRSEMPEHNKRLQVRKITLLNQQFGICIDENKTRIWDTVENHIENYPVAVYNHIYKYKTNEIQKLTLCSVGLKKIQKKIEEVKPTLISSLRTKKYMDKVNARVSKLLKKTDPLSRVKN